MLGRAVGGDDGLPVGRRDGLCDGRPRVGRSEGFAIGWRDGRAVGCRVGRTDGLVLGLFVGRTDGFEVGLAERQVERPQIVATCSTQT